MKGRLIIGYCRWCETPALPVDPGAADADAQAPVSEAAVVAAVPPAFPQVLPTMPESAGGEPAAKRLRPAAGVVCNPLAAVAGPEVRRRLKQGGCKSATLACGEGAPSTSASASVPVVLDVQGPTFAASIAVTAPEGG